MRHLLSVVRDPWTVVWVGLGLVALLLLLRVTGTPTRRELSSIAFWVMCLGVVALGPISLLFLLFTGGEQ